MRFYRRRLPHIDAPGVPTFITFRLWGSLPAERVFKPEHLNSDEAFAAWDRLLDTARTGPFYLRQPAIAQMVKDHLHQAPCAVHAYAIMPNHVHVLCTPTIALPDLVQRLKGSTAHKANQISGRTGEKFWQEEYFDRMVRGGEAFDRIRWYIEWNPVKAGLVARPEEFPWSSGWRG